MTETRVRCVNNFTNGLFESDCNTGDKTDITEILVYSDRNYLLQFDISADLLI